MGLEYWPCYHSYRKKCEKLTDQELGRLVRSLMIFSETGERQELAGRESIAFDFIADDIARAKENYESRCEANRENGKKAKRTVANATERMPSVANGSETSQSKSESESKDKSESEYLKPPVPARAREENPEIGKVMRFYLDHVNPAPSATCLDLLKQYSGTLGADVTIHALEIAIDEGKRNWSYIQAILQRCESAGIRSLEDFRRAEDERRKSREAAAPGKRMSKSEAFSAAGRDHHRTAADMDKLLNALGEI